MELQTINASASPEVQINENFETLQYASVYGKRQPVTSGLTWGYYGGIWGGFTVTAGTLSLTDNSDNYIVVAIVSGVISISTSSTNWNNTSTYARAYKITTVGGVVTTVEDHRAGPGGISSAGSAGVGTVTSVNLTQPAAGITVSGGPITTSGSITLALANDLAAVEALATTGIVRRTGVSTWSAGTAVDLTSEVTGVLPIANGGTNGSTQAGARTGLGLGTVAILASDTDGTLAANSDANVATQKAVKTYVDTLVTSGAVDVMIFKGVIDCSANPNYPAANAGNLYKISVAGKIGGASGPNVEAGDTIYCITDSTASGIQAAVGANWVIAQVNIDGAVTGPASATSGHLATFSGTSGKIIADGGAAPTGTNTGDQTITLTGDVTGSGTGSFAATIANDAVTYAKMQNVSTTSRILGRKTAGAGDTEECTLSEILDFVTSAAQGDILYRGAATWTRLAAGTSGQLLETLGAGANPAWQSQPYDLGGLCAGTPAASLVIMRFPIPRAVVFPVSLTGSRGVAGTAATAQTDFDILKNGVSFGTMRFAAAATTSTFISAAGSTFAAGDVLTVVAPGTPDATLADVGFALTGTR